MRIGFRKSSLAIGAIASGILFVSLLAAGAGSWDRLRAVSAAHGPYRIGIGARKAGVGLQLRRTHTYRQTGPMGSSSSMGPGGPAKGWNVWSASVPDAPLETMCIQTRGRWVLPGLWFGAGRDTYVDFIDLTLPAWLTLPMCLLLPALWWRKRGRTAKGFEVGTPPAPSQPEAPSPVREA